MTIKEIAELITKEKYLFQVSIPDSHFLHGKTTVDIALIDCDSLESYFEKIAKYNNTSLLIVSLFFLSGNSYKNRGIYPISIPETIAVATVNRPVATENEITVAMGNITENNPNISNKIPTESQNKPKTNPMDTKDYIDFRVLQTEHKNLTQRYEDSKSKVTKLEKKIEDLHDENKQLLRDNATKEDKHSLALERAKLEMEREGKEGLSGILGELQENPMIVEAVVGFLNPKHPMFDKNKEQKTLEGSDHENREIKYTNDTEINLVLNDIPRKLSQTTGDTISKIYLLFQEFLAKPDILNTVANTYFPDIFKK